MACPKRGESCPWLVRFTAFNYASRGDATPPKLDTPGKRALYNNLGQDEDLALKIDEAVKASRPDGWRGVEPKERVIKAAIYAIVKDKDAVERLFTIIRAQAEY
ncbi:hypothetical protein V5F29_17730 [Xanthobacter aminoxidans]|uniref:hypothetical protein n=1 Tax=Xanthobacter aminoxidans TaxID=186280 RepID=UPI0037275878